MKRRLLGKIAGYITYSTVTINKTYGDIDFINPITITGDGIITYSSNNTTVATINQNTGQVTILKPGEAIITATVTDSDYYSYETKNITYTLSVAKAAGNVSEPPASATVPYTGNPQQLVTSGSGTGTMMYKLNNEIWSTEIPTATNCDTYTIYYKSSENDYYTESAVGSLLVTITLSTPDYIAPTAKILVYNGNELELLNAGSTSDGTFYYSTDNSTWSESIPKGTNANSYTTYWKLEGDNNHTSISSTRVDVTIDKAENSLTATKHDDWTYDGESYSLVSDVSGQGTITYSLNGGSDSLIIPQASDAGTYVVKIKATGDSNHYSKEISYTIVVNKVTPTVTITSRTVTYNRSALNLITSSGSDFGTLLFSLDETNWSTTIPTATNAGVYLVYYRVIGDSNISDIESTAVSPISEISPKSVTATITLLYDSHVYTGEALTPTVVAKDGSITIPSTEYTVNYTNNTNAGTATVTLTDKANGNYIVTGSTTFVITKADGRIDVLPVGKDLVYTGESQVIATAGSGTGVMYYALEQDPTYSSDIPSLVNAGTYTMYFYAAESTNYTQSTTKSILITIAKANPTYTAPISKTGLVYSGEALALLNTGSIASGNGILQYSSDNSTWSGTIPSETNAGQYTSYWRIVGNSNYNDKESTSITTTITKHAGVINTAPTKKNLTYNGNSQALVTAGSGSGTMLYKLGSDGTWSNDIPTGTIVGDYDVYYKVLESSNYFATDGSTYVTSSISKVTPTVEAPTAKNLTYTGEALTLINAGTTNFGILKYSLDNSTYSTSLPTGTNATTYIVYYRVDGDSNINDVAAKSIAVTIAKAAPSYTAPTAKTGLVYNTSAQALLNEGSASGGTLLYSSDNSTWGTTIPTGTNASSYTSYWRIVGDSNHADKASASISTTISPKTIDSPTITLSQDSYTYNGSACQPTPTVKDGTVTISSGEYTISYSDNVNAGTATCTITDKSGGNYTVSGSKTFTISKVTPTVTAPTAKVLTYNGSALTLANAGSTNFGTLKYSLDNSTWSTSIPTATNTGSYTLYYKVDGDSNVNSVSASSINCSINEKEVTATVILSTSSYTYDGNAKTPSVTVKDGSTVIPSSEYTVSYSNNVNAGTASVTITDNTGGNYNVIGSATFTINKAGGSVSTKPTAKSLTYNGNSLTLANAGSGTGTMYYRLGTSGNFSTTIPSATNAGNYTVLYYAAESSNYTLSSTGEISVTISKVTPSVTAPSAKSLSYTGEAQTLANAGSTNWGTILYSLDNSSYSTSIPSGTGAGNYTLYYRVVGDSNINSWGPSSISCSIGKVSPSYTAPTNANPTYNGNSLYYMTTGSTSHGTIQYSSNNSTWSTTRPTGVNAGGYTGYWRLIGDSNHTDIGSTSVSCSIAQAPMTGSAPTPKSLTYNGNALTLANAGSASGGSIYYSLDNSSWSGSIPSRTNAGGYTVYYTFSPDSNHYAISGGYISCSIGKASNPISISPNSWTYDGNTRNMISCSGVGTPLYSVNDGSWTTTMPTATNAGSWSVRVYYGGNSNYNDGYSSYVTCTVSKASGYASVSAKSLTYNGSAQSLGTLNYASGTVYYSLDNSSWSTSMPSQTNAGSWTLYYYVAESSNYTSNGTWTVGVGISKAGGSVTTAPTNRGVTYSGSAQTLANAGSGTGTMYYSLNNSSWSTSIPTATNAGSWTLYYFAAESSNYTLSSTGTVGVSIGKAGGSAYATGNSWTYDGNARGMIYNAGGYGSLLYLQLGGSWVTSIPTATNAGTYYCRVYSSGDSNHNEAYSGWYTCTVSQASGSVSISGVSLTYNGNSRSLASVSGNTGTMHYSTDYSNWSTSIPSATNTGSWTIYWYMDASTNYAGIGASTSRYVSSSIGKASLSAPTAYDSTTTYPTTATASASGGGGQGSLEWESALSQTSVGSHTTRARWSGNSNYYASGWSGYVTVLMVKADQSAPSVSGSTVTYPNTAYASASGGGGLGSIEWSNGSSRSAVGYLDTYARWSGNGNYNASPWSSSYARLTVNKANPSITATPTDRGGTYTGSAQNLLQGGSANVSGSFSYSTATNAGTYTATWTFTPTDTTNYNSVSGNVTAHIYKATPTVTSVPQANNNLVYNGLAQALCTAGVVGSVPGTFYYGGNPSWQTSPPTIVHGGCGYYSFDWKFTPNDTTNYKELSGSFSDIYMSPASRTLTWSSNPSTVNVGSTIIVSITSPGGGEIRYGSSNTGVATVSGNTITGVSAGTTTITAVRYSDCDYALASTSYTLTVQYGNIWKNERIWTNGLIWRS